MNDERVWMTNEDKMMMMDTNRSQRASIGSPYHRRKQTREQRTTAPSLKADEQPAITNLSTSEQWITALSSKADEQAADHRAIIEGRRATSHN